MRLYSAQSGLTLAWLLIAAGQSVVADDQPEMRVRVNELIQQLDSTTLNERRRAENQLLELGPDILSLLPSLDLTENAARRESIRVIRNQLERQAARDSSAASRVTLSGELPVSKIIGEIVKQSQNRLVIVDQAIPVRDRRLSINWNAVSFWECLDELCRRSELQWSFDKDQSLIQLATLDPSAAPAISIQHAGPFRIQVTGVERHHVVGDESQQIVRLIVRLSIEPRLRPLFLSLKADQLFAITNMDLRLAAWNPDAKYEFPFAEAGHEITIQTDFRLAPGINVNSISVRGPLSCLIAAATERLVFDQKSLTGNSLRRRGGVSVKLSNVAFAKAAAEKQDGKIGLFVIYDDGGPAFESHRSWIYHNAAYLESKAGNRINFNTFDTNQQFDGAVVVEYHWNDLPGPNDQYQFVYEAPTLIVSVPIKMDLVDVPISK